MQLVTAVQLQQLISLVLSEKVPEQQMEKLLKIFPLIFKANIDQLDMSLLERVLGLKESAKEEEEERPLATETPAGSKVPHDGDRAYVWSRGYEYVGILQTGRDSMMGKKTRYRCSELVPDPKHQWHSDCPFKYGISVGYDEPTVWDEERGMFRANEDYD